MGSQLEKYNDALFYGKSRLRRTVIKDQRNLRILRESVLLVLVTGLDSG